MYVLLGTKQLAFSWSKDLSCGHYSAWFPFCYQSAHCLPGIFPLTMCSSRLIQTLFCNKLNVTRGAQLLLWPFLALCSFTRQLLPQYSILFCQHFELFAPQVKFIAYSCQHSGFDVGRGKLIGRKAPRVCCLHATSWHINPT